MYRRPKFLEILHEIREEVSTAVGRAKRLPAIHIPPGD